MAEKTYKARIFLDMGMLCIQSQTFELILTDEKAVSVVGAYADDPRARLNPTRTVAGIRRGNAVSVQVPLSVLRRGDKLQPGVSYR